MRTGEPPSRKERVQGLIQPGYLLSIAIYHFFMTILEIVFRDRDPLTLLDVEKVKHKSFGRLWLKNGTLLSLQMAPQIEALLQTIQGTVLDLGPGTGTQMHRMNPNGVKVVYGVEPVVAMHEELADNAKKAGFGAKYKILGCGAEQESLIPALAKAGLFKEGASRGVFDEIVCLRVMCGVPRPEETMTNLYRLLKPGGRIIFAEHVKNSWRYKYGSYLGCLLQNVYTLCGWRLWMGGCDLRRDTGAWLLRAGGEHGWSDTKVEYIDGWAPVPYVIGYMTKTEATS